MRKRTELFSLRVIFLLVIIFTLLLFGTRVFGQEDSQFSGGKYIVIRASDLHEMMGHKDFILINVSFKCDGFIPGTDGDVPFNLIDREAGCLPPPEDSKVVLYCNRGYMSRVAARKLLTMGYREIYILEGGLEQWEIEGHPVTSALKK